MGAALRDLARGSARLCVRLCAALRARLARRLCARGSARLYARGGAVYVWLWGACVWMQAGGGCGKPPKSKHSDFLKRFAPRLKIFRIE